MTDHVSTDLRKVGDRKRGQKGGGGGFRGEGGERERT